MGVGLGGRDTGGNMDLDNTGVRKEAEVNNCGEFHMEADLQTMYRRGEYGDIQ